MELGAQELRIYNSSMDPPRGRSAYLAEWRTALGTLDAVKTAWRDLKGNFLRGRYRSVTITTLFVRVSIEEVAIHSSRPCDSDSLWSLIFCQNWRGQPHSGPGRDARRDFGTFAGMYGLGFLNKSLDVFGLVLAFGIVVDDAIVVLEKVERS